MSRAIPAARRVAAPRTTATLAGILALGILVEATFAGGLACQPSEARVARHWRAVRLASESLIVLAIAAIATGVVSSVPDARAS